MEGIMDRSYTASLGPRSETVAFWDRLYQGITSYSSGPDENIERALRSAQSFFHCRQGCKILDIGCGRGMTSIFWASTGAQVTAIDYSASAIAKLSEHCEQTGIANIKPVVGDAMAVDELGQFDYVFGSMILHHLEPFGEFVPALRRTLKPNGKAFFYENNAASDLLIWFRNNLVGKLGVPKVGDEDESPLAPQEIDLLRKSFSVSVNYPEMMFFQLASAYLFRDHLGSGLKAIDDFLYKKNVGVRYSYRQYVLLEA
jgi:2-polyprenyl-3-methyl-5-hydroxy-6-metoxy-1,4-benzoquinol methylase